VHSVFVPYSPSHTLSPHLLPPSAINPPPHPGRACSAFLFLDFAKEKKKKCHFCLFKITTQEFPCGTSMYTCITIVFFIVVF
jgi:hypothetical protein